MISIDTNILLRYYTEDAGHKETVAQRNLVKRLFEAGEKLYVPITVVLEFEWVLRAHYELKALAVKEALMHLIGLPNCHVEDWVAVEEAALLSVQGLDFADALHQCRQKGVDEMLTFDHKKFVSRAHKLGLFPPVNLLDEAHFKS